MRWRPLSLVIGMALLAGTAMPALAAGPSQGAEPPVPLNAESVAGLIHQAETTRQEAAELGAEWLDTERLIRQARQAAERGDLEKAAELGRRAQQQATLAIEQAKRESQAWQRRVVR
jgi:hypothetical protein